MGRRSRTSKETKLLAIHTYQSGKSSMDGIATQLGVCRSTFRPWISHYASEGENAFEEKPRNLS